jgi:hypothetical protein
MTRTPIPPPPMGATPAPSAFPGEPIPSHQTAPIARHERNRDMKTESTSNSLSEYRAQLIREVDASVTGHPDKALTSQARIRLRMIQLIDELLHWHEAASDPNAAVYYALDPHGRDRMAIAAPGSRVSSDVQGEVSA